MFKIHFTKIRYLETIKGSICVVSFISKQSLYNILCVSSMQFSFSCFFLPSICFAFFFFFLLLDKKQFTILIDKLTWHYHGYFQHVEKVMAILFNHVRVFSVFANLLGMNDGRYISKVRRCFSRFCRGGCRKWPHTLNMTAYKF